MATRNDILDILHELAPPESAAEWDNTGLLVEAGDGMAVDRVLLTLDLTPEVAKEAARKKSGLVLAYHPPIFSGLRGLSRRDPLTAALLDLVAAGISVYSPHTALDAAPGGISDWLCKPFPESDAEPVEGSGRRLTLKPALSLVEVGQRLRDHLGLPYLRIASPPGRAKQIKTLGLCPGSGASVLRGLSADAVFTGEMKHHDILAFRNAGVHVLISEHGHSERPYLRVLKTRLRERLPAGVKVEISRRDREPLALVMSDA